MAQIKHAVVTRGSLAAGALKEGAWKCTCRGERKFVTLYAMSSIACKVVDARDR